MLQYSEYPPSSGLSAFIKMFWTLESDLPYVHHSMADICPELLFHYNGEFEEILTNGKTNPSFSSGIHGQTANPRKFSIDKSFSLFGVSLYPYTLSILFQMAAGEFTNEMPSLDAVMHREGSILEEKIGEAMSTQDRIRIIEDFVVQKLKRSLTVEEPVMYCIRSLIHNNSSKNIKALASECFLSERQFQRRFGEFSGMSPKLFSRVSRFLSAANHFSKQDRSSLTQIAYECGYYDQSHFIHDFKKFSGLTPNQYFSGSSEATDWRS